MPSFPLPRPVLILAAALLWAGGTADPARADTPPLLPVAELRPGMEGVVWTVFRGTEPESFKVQVTGVVANALGPGKAMILCRLTDPRVQASGATAGMSGSPLYIDGKLAGALSYQVQSFETERYAGFTPAADLAEVRDLGRSAKGRSPAPSPVPPTPPGPSPLPTGEQPLRGELGAAGTRAVSAGNGSWSPLRPVFLLGGVSPAVAAVVGPQFAALGIEVSSLGGSASETAPAASQAKAAPAAPPRLKPGSAVAVGLAVGDITLAGTGTVSLVDGDVITAFGHPLLSLGAAALPLCSSEIVTILPSSFRSVKIANTGDVIGTLEQDRLSAVSGRLGPGPAMIDVEVSIPGNGRPARALRFRAVRQPYLTAQIIGTAVLQGLAGSNDAGVSEGFRLAGRLRFAGGETLETKALYPGPQAFILALTDFVAQLNQQLHNPYERNYPEQVHFSVEALQANPIAVVQGLNVSRRMIRPGETVDITVSWRDYQGEDRREVVPVAIPAAWAGKTLEIVLAGGRQLDELTGEPRARLAAQFRSLGAYLDTLRRARASDGLYLAVLERSALFTDQGRPTQALPGSLERIARASDEARYQSTEALRPLWERHLLPGRLAQAEVRKLLQVAE